MSEEFVLYEQTGAVVTLTLNNPDERNALSTQAQWDAIVDACDRIQADNSVKAVVLTGAGSAFCAGGNVHHMKARSGIAAGSGMQIREGYRRGIQRIPVAMWHLDVPTIAAVNGPAIGAGCDLACMCDIRIASDKAKFAESFVKLGIIPGDGGAWLLPRIIGFSRATELALTGEMIDAAEALKIGLVSHVVSDADLMAKAREIAAKIAANPPHAVRMTKRLLREGQMADLKNILEMSAAIQSLSHNTRDNDEAINAFIEKRTPVFTGE